MPTPAPLLQYLVKEEKVTNVKFASVGVSVPPPDPRDPFAPLPPRQTKVLIVFVKTSLRGAHGDEAIKFVLVTLWIASRRSQ